MLRSTAALVLLAALASVGNACPWWGHRCPPPPLIYYPPCPPPVIVRTIPPPAEPPKVQPEPPKAPAEPVFDPVELYERCVKSCVFIVAPMKGGHSEGSGSLIDTEKRLVITCAHVVGNVEFVFCQFPVYNKDGSLITDKRKYIERIPAGQAIKGKVLYRDNSRDLALVQLDRLPPDTPAIPLAKKSVRVGEKVISIGNPGKVDSTFSTTDAVVRAVDVRDFVVGGSDGVMRIRAKFVTATNPVGPGDSGGPLIDKRGYQIAVTERGIFDERAQNVNGFVDVTEVWAFLAEKKVTIKELSTEPGKPEVAAKVSPTEPTTPTADDKRKASDLLKKAKLFKDDDQDFYKSKLRELIRKYPGTAAATEAQKLLDGVK